MFLEKTCSAILPFGAWFIPNPGGALPARSHDSNLPNSSRLVSMYITHVTGNEREARSAWFLLSAKNSISLSKSMTAEGGGLGYRIGDCLWEERKFNFSLSTCFLNFT